MTFHTDLRGEKQAFALVKDEYFPDRYPSWTAVGVTQLALPELCVEIRAPSRPPGAGADHAGHCVSPRISVWRRSSGPSAATRD